MTLLFFLACNVSAPPAAEVVPTVVQKADDPALSREKPKGPVYTKLEKGEPVAAAIVEGLPKAEADALVAGFPKSVWKGARMTVTIDEPGKMVLTWEQMKGEPVTGTYTYADQRILVEWPNVRNTLNIRWQAVPTGPCKWTVVHRTFRNGVEKDETVDFEKEGCTP